MPAARTRLARTAALLALAFAAGCGGTGSGADATTSATTPAARAQDAATARAALLRLEDLPRGWRSRPVAPGSPPSDCPALARARRAATGLADPRTSFVPPDAPLLVDDVVTIFADERASRTAFADLTRAGTIACLARGLASDDGTTRVARPRTSRLLVGARADAVSATRFTTTLTADGERHGVDADAVVLRQGRGVSRLRLTAEDRPAAYAVRAAAVQGAARRLADALAATGR